MKIISRALWVALFRPLWNKVIYILLFFYTSLGAMDFHQVFDMVLLVYICFCTRILYPFTQRWRKTCLRRKWLHLFWQIWPDHNQGDLSRAIDNKTVGWYGISICLDMFSSQFLDWIGQLDKFFFAFLWFFFHWQLFWYFLCFWVKIKTNC